MTTDELSALPYDQLVALARQSLGNSDLEALRQLDSVFHQLFFNEARRGTQRSRTDFIAAMLKILDSNEAHGHPPAAELPRYLSRWEHLDVLMDAFRGERDPLAEAQRLVASRNKGQGLLKEVARAGALGILAGELATRLDISPQQLSRLLGEFEANDIIERFPRGRSVFVCLGLRGQLIEERLAEAGVGAAQAAAAAAGTEAGASEAQVAATVRRDLPAPEPWRFPDGSACLGPIPSPRQLLSVQAMSTGRVM